jgi:lipoate-protein ligase A
MAVDEAILESCIDGFVPPTLRFYAWDPPCLSLGYAQPSSDIDYAQLTKFGWDLVRRPTGGRSILHTDELTYSVIGTSREPRFSGGVLECYRHLSIALLAGLRYLSLPATSSAEAADPAADRGNPVCFEVPSSFEITINDKKIIGSAQARRRSGVLQHGSLPLHGDLSRITLALKYPDKNSRHAAAARLLRRATTLESALGFPADWRLAAGAMIRAFQAELNLNLEPGQLSLEEGHRAYRLFQMKYTHPSWLSNH